MSEEIDQYKNKLLKIWEKMKVRPIDVNPESWTKNFRGSGHFNTASYKVTFCFDSSGTDCRLHIV